MVRPDFVRRKLELIAEELGRLMRFEKATYDEIVGDDLKLAAVERILERIVNRAIDVNEHLISECSGGREDKITRLTYKETFLKLADLGVYEKAFALDISKSAGLRNVLVHEYNDVDRKIVYGSIRECVEHYRVYVQSVSAVISKFEDDGSRS